METDNYQKVKDALELIRPYLQADGGDISLIEVSDDMVVKVRLLGSCMGCPMSYQTMKNGVEQVVKKALPDVKEVVTIN